VKLVYLDLNQWIGLAKAASAHKDGARYVQALEAARAAKDGGTAMFPLSGTHYMELAEDGPEEFDRMLREMNIKLERAMLRGPSPLPAQPFR
jgi:hypothetical protein